MRAKVLMAPRQDGHEITVAADAVERTTVGSKEVGGGQHVDRFAVSCGVLPVRAPLRTHTKVGREERGEDHDFGHDEHPDARFANVLAFEGV